MTSGIITEQMGSIMNFAVQSNGKQEDVQDAFNKLMEGMTKDLMDVKSESDGLGKTSQMNHSKNDSAMNTNVQHRDSAKQDAVTEREDASKEVDAAQKVESGRQDDDAVEKTAAKSEIKMDADVDEENVEVAYQSMIDLLLQLQSDVIDILDTNVGDMMEAMNDLDLTMIDLLDPENMQKLLLQMNGVDETSLLTDESVYQQMKNLNELAQSAKEALLEVADASNSGLTKWEDLKAALEDHMRAITGAEDAKKTDLPNTPYFRADNSERLVLGEETNGVAKKVAQLDAELKDVVANREDIRQEQVNTQMSHENQGDLSQNPEQRNTADAQENLSAQMRESGKEQGRVEEHETAQSALFADFMKEGVNEAGMQEAMQGSVSMAPDTEAIMKQIVDYMKSVRTTEMSEVEMQLHPQELGTLHISVASKNGLVTAQLAAENESVKAVLESQVEVLRENLSQAGVKIEAVEVTVASHEFERNLDQQAHQDENAEAQAQEHKKNMRRINLNFAEEDADIVVDEAETIARDMMMRHGNSLDYMA